MSRGWVFAFLAIGALLICAGSVAVFNGYAISAVPVATGVFVAGMALRVLREDS